MNDQLLDNSFETIVGNSGPEVRNQLSIDELQRSHDSARFRCEARNHPDLAAISITFRLDLRRTYSVRLAMKLLQRKSVALHTNLNHIPNILQLSFALIRTSNALLASVG
jgi:hypothetical protein